MTPGRLALAGDRQTQTAQQGGTNREEVFELDIVSVKLRFCRQLQKHLEQGRANRLRGLLLLMTLNSENLPVFFFLGPFKLKILFYFFRLKCVVALVPFLATLPLY